MSQAIYHDRMKICAHLRDLNVYKNLQRPLQFSKDIWNAFYQSEVLLKAARQLKEITKQLAKAKKARKFRRSDYDLKTLELKLAECQLVVDEVGDPPLKFLKAAERVKLVPNTTHRLGQGGIPGLKAAFASKGESESSQGNSDEEEKASTAPNATTSSGPIHLLVEMQVLQGVEIKKIGRRTRTRTRGRGTMKRGRRMSNPPPPPENTRKKDSRKKSKRGRKFPF
ncbi:unnamed protein product [Sphagnum troendelagicum]|uniref:Uncharacterized protein n=1 Tax=Sphagnum troendelagicum TaxID=128251 RepID=A0ABP0TBV2_9BRYO